MLSHSDFGYFLAGLLQNFLHEVIIEDHLEIKLVQTASYHLPILHWLFTSPVRCTGFLYFCQVHVQMVAITFKAQNGTWLGYPKDWLSLRVFGHPTRSDEFTSSTLLWMLSLKRHSSPCLVEHHPFLDPTDYHPFLPFRKSWRPGFYPKCQLGWDWSPTNISCFDSFVLSITEGFLCFIVLLWSSLLYIRWVAMSLF